MAVAGRRPKPDGQAVNRNQKSAEWTEVVNVPYSGPRPEFPEVRTIVTSDGPIEVALQDLTVKWWETVSTMPHCVMWEPSDWVFAVATGLVADAAFCGGVGAATELRNREKVLGTTAEYRRGLRIRYVDAQDEVGDSSQGVTNINDYRDL